MFVSAFQEVIILSIIVKLVLRENNHINWVGHDIPDTKLESVSNLSISKLLSFLYLL